MSYPFFSFFLYTFYLQVSNKRQRVAIYHFPPRSQKLTKKKKLQLKKLLIMIVSFFIQTCIELRTKG